MQTPTGKFPKVRPFVLLAGLSVISIGLVTATDQAVAEMLPASLKKIAYIRIPSVLVCLLAWVAFARAPALRLKIRTVPWRRLALPAAVWLVPTGILTLGHWVWIPQISGAIDTTAFMVTGLLAEEFLFRGALFDRFLALPGAYSRPKFAIAGSAVLFGFSHLQYHHFVFTPAATTQIMYATLLGVLLGIIRERSGSIWPGATVHMIGNALVLLANRY